MPEEPLITTNNENSGRGESNYAAALTFVNDIKANTDQTSQNPGEQPQLDAPVAAKELVDKGNGTYDLSLSITGKSKSSSESSKADVLVILDQSGSMDSTRLQAAKNAVAALTDSLMGNNTSQNPDAVRMALITFGNNANPTRDWTSDAGTFKGAVNNLEVQWNVGTNWEAALRLANTITTRDDAEKYVIFVSDGNPTFYVNGSYRDGTGQENPENVALCYYFAKDDAYTLVQNGFHFYTIGVFGNVSRMQNLTAYAYSGTDNGSYPSEHYQTASDEKSLVKAFENIIDQITHNLGYQAVTFTDGLTAMTSSTLVNGKAAGFNYTVTDADGKPVAVTDNKNKTFSYKNSAGATKTFRGATYKDGTVTWSMDVDDSTPFVLDGGYTYKVTFTVWPKQEAYDLAAGLMNGTISYDSLSDVQKNQIVSTTENGQTTYSLKTNTDGTNVKYRPVTETTSSSGTVDTIVGDEGTATIPNPSGVSLAATKFEVVKVWMDDDVDPKSKYRPESIKFDLVQDKTQTVVRNCTLSADNGWTTTVYIAPGLKVGDAVKEPGHTYDIVEKDTDFRYELVTKTYHPMLIDSNTQIYDGESKTDSLGNSMVITQFVAENELKGSLSLEKRVLDTEGTDITTVGTGTSETVNPAIKDETFAFVFDVTLVSPKAREDKDYRYAFYGQSTIGVKNPEELKDADKISDYSLTVNAEENTTTVHFTVTLKPGERFDLPFVPLNTKYTITEKATNSNYTYDSAECSDTEAVVTRDRDGNPTITATVAADTKDSVVVKNKRDAVNLTVTKVVTGNVADKNKNFTFKLVIEGGEKAVSLTNEKALTEGTGGEYTFTLKHDERIQIRVPKGVKYTVEEMDKGDYQLEVTAEGSTVGNATETGYSDTPAGDTSLKFTNKLDAPLTGVREHVNLAFVPVVLFALAGLFYFSRSRY